MRTHTSDFKNAIKNLGRILKATISYGNTTLEEEILMITPLFEGNILKSIMKQLNLELTVDIPTETIINCQIGILVNNNYEMINFGNYVVYKSEKKEDTNSYLITCYDKMIYAMKQNEDLEVIYPITIKNYLTALANKIGLSVATETFYNSSLSVPSELYLGLEYTYRDILDEIAQATGSIIRLNVDDEIEVIYPTNTNDVINEEFLKNINVDFGAKYGPINSIVLSRSGGSDNVYIQDIESIEENGLCEVKIVDNQIMNFNNRSDFLQGLLDALDGIEYYINGFNSTGILYYEVGDLYSVQVGEQVYKCLMLNDEINITQGIEEIIHTEMPEESETDYSKADKTDRRINQTYLIVDKQNQTIDAVVSQTIDTSNPDSTINKVTSLNIRVGELESSISEAMDLTTSAESQNAKVTLENVNESQPINIKIHPIVENICYLYPYSTLYPSSTLYSKSRILRFTNKDTNEVFDWVLPTDLWYYSATIYDELELSYGDGTNSTVVVTRKCEVNANGSISALQSPTTETYEYPSYILLTEGDYDVELVDNMNGYLYVQLMAQNIYTTQFATKAELNTSITQTEAEITSVASAKVGNDEIISKINQSSEAVTINANKISLAGKSINLTGDDINITSTNFSIDTSGNIVANSGTMGGWNLSSQGLIDESGEIYIRKNGYSSIYTYADLIIIRNYLLGRIDLTDNDIQEHYDITGDGEVDSADLLLMRRRILGLE